MISSRHSSSLYVCLFLAGTLLSSPGIAGAQSAGTAPPTPPVAPAQSEAAESGDEQKRFFDTVTVSATLNASPVMETPGAVSVVDSAAIERRLVENIADLV